MAEKNFLSWIGFKDESNNSSTSPASKPGDPSTKSVGAGSASNTPYERIRDLEAELADLRARRDITSLTREEFEILATETATALIKTAQAREAKAIATAERALSEAQRSVKQLTESAELKARNALQSAEGRGRKYLEAAESEAKEALEKAAKAAQDLLDAKNREAATITSAAKREADRVVGEATADIANFKQWLSDAIAESERLHKVQSQALAAAEEGMRQSRAKITTAFERLSALGNEIEAAVGVDHRPKEREFTRATPPVAERSSTKKSTTTQSGTARKNVGRAPKQK